jgi:hypothetical protein
LLFINKKDIEFILSKSTEPKKIIIKLINIIIKKSPILLIMNIFITAFILLTLSDQKLTKK